MTEIVRRDFLPINKWTPNGYHLIDNTTGRAYWNESRKLVWFKCLLLTFGTVPVHIVAATKANLSSLRSLLRPNTPPPPTTFERVVLAFFKTPPAVQVNRQLKKHMKDLAFIALSPLTIVGLELSALYGLISPWNGRKLYASLERLQYGKYVLAPCFQPDPKTHLFNIVIGGATF